MEYLDEYKDWREMAGRFGQEDPEIRGKRLKRTQKDGLLSVRKAFEG